jgi:hypothetical protein
MKKRPTSECIECNRIILGKKARCNRCAIRRTRQHWVGSECECCGDARRVVLVRRDLATALDEIGRPVARVSTTLCGSCSVVLGRQKMTLVQLAAEVGRYDVAEAS